MIASIIKTVELRAISEKGDDTCTTILSLNQSTVVNVSYRCYVRPGNLVDVCTVSS